MKNQSGKNKLELMRNLFLIKININRAGIFPLSFSKYFWFNTFSQNIKYCSVAFSPLFSIA